MRTDDDAFDCADLYRFKTHRMVSDLGIHEISYAAW